jgi:hypothetical protein
MPSFADEAAVTQRLLGATGLPYTGLSNPLARYGRETGADVEICYEGRKIGIQVTDCCADEGIADPGRGLRATEKRNAAQGSSPRTLFRCSISLRRCCSAPTTRSKRRAAIRSSSLTRSGCSSRARSRRWTP